MAIMMELRKWVLACPANSSNLIFFDEQSEPIEPTYLTREHFSLVLKAIAVKQIRFHGLRHTYASILIKQGENLKYIQSQMEHANPTVTLNTSMSPVGVCKSRGCMQT